MDYYRGNISTVIQSLVLEIDIPVDIVKNPNHKSLHSHHISVPMTKSVITNISIRVNTNINYQTIPEVKADIFIYSR